MLLIAHRGLLDGPNKDLENHPSSFQLCRELGYDVEIDLRFVNGEWWLGHDEAQYKVNYEFLQNIDKRGYLDQHHAWIHTKNIDALYELMRRHWEGHVFWHQNDDVVVTTTGYLWTYPGKQLTPLSICVMPEWTDQLSSIKTANCFGVCSDYVKVIEKGW